MPSTVPIKSVELPRQDSRMHYSQLQYSGVACLKHSSFLKVKGPQVSTIQLRTCRVARLLLTECKSNYELFNCNNFNIRYWSWNYRGCWTRLALQWVLAKTFTLCSFQSTRQSPLLLFLVTTSLSQDWVICAPAAFLRCGSRLSGSLSGIEP